MVLSVVRDRVSPRELTAHRSTGRLVFGRNDRTGARPRMRRASPTLTRSWRSRRCDGAGPGGAPAAKRGRTAWRGAVATATLGHEEGHVRTVVTDIDQGEDRFVRSDAANKCGHSARTQSPRAASRSRRPCFRPGQQVPGRGGLGLRHRADRTRPPRTGRTRRGAAAGRDPRGQRGPSRAGSHPEAQRPADAGASRRRRGTRADRTRGRPGGRLAADDSVTARPPN